MPLVHCSKLSPYKLQNKQASIDDFARTQSEKCTDCVPPTDKTNKNKGDKEEIVLTFALSIRQISYSPPEYQYQLTRVHTTKGYLASIQKILEQTTDQSLTLNNLLIQLQPLFPHNSPYKLNRYVSPASSYTNDQLLLTLTRDEQKRLRSILEIYLADSLYIECITSGFENAGNPSCNFAPNNCIDIPYFIASCAKKHFISSLLLKLSTNKLNDAAASKAPTPKEKLPLKHSSLPDGNSDINYSIYEYPSSSTSLQASLLAASKIPPSHKHTVSSNATATPLDFSGKHQHVKKSNPCTSNTSRPIQKKEDFNIAKYKSHSPSDSPIEMCNQIEYIQLEQQLSINNYTQALNKLLNNQKSCPCPKTHIPFFLVKLTTSNTTNLWLLDTVTTSTNKDTTHYVQMGLAHVDTNIWDKVPYLLTDTSNYYEKDRIYLALQLLKEGRELVTAKEELKQNAKLTEHYISSLNTGEIKKIYDICCTVTGIMLAININKKAENIINPKYKPIKTAREGALLLIGNYLNAPKLPDKWPQLRVKGHQNIQPMLMLNYLNISQSAWRTISQTIRLHVFSLVDTQKQAAMPIGGQESTLPISPDHSAPWKSVTYSTNTSTTVSLSANHEKSLFTIFPQPSPLTLPLTKTFIEACPYITSIPLMQEFTAKDYFNALAQLKSTLKTQHKCKDSALHLPYFILDHDEIKKSGEPTIGFSSPPPLSLTKRTQLGIAHINKEVWVKLRMLLKGGNDLDADQLLYSTILLIKENEDTYIEELKNSNEKINQYFMQLELNNVINISNIIHTSIGLLLSIELNNKYTSLKYANTKSFESLSDRIEFEIDCLEENLGFAKHIGSNIPVDSTLICLTSLLKENREHKKNWIRVAKKIEALKKERLLKTSKITVTPRIHSKMPSLRVEEQRSSLPTNLWQKSTDTTLKDLDVSNKVTTPLYIQPTHLATTKMDIMQLLEEDKRKKVQLSRIRSKLQTTLPPTNSYASTTTVTTNNVTFTSEPIAAIKTSSLSAFINPDPLTIYVDSLNQFRKQNLQKTQTAKEQADNIERLNKIRAGTLPLAYSKKGKYEPSDLQISTQRVGEGVGIRQKNIEVTDDLPKTPPKIQDNNEASLPPPKKYKRA